MNNETPDFTEFKRWFNTWWCNEHKTVPYPADTKYVNYVNAYAMASAAWIASRQHYESYEH